MSLQNRLKELNEELECANGAMQSLLNMGEVDVSFQIEAINEDIVKITKEMASIIDAMK